MLIMNSAIDGVCISCLSTERNVSQLNPMKADFFTSIVCDQMGSAVELVPEYKLCWECTGLVDKMYKFRCRARRSLEFLQQYLKKSVKFPKSASHLCLSTMSTHTPAVHAEFSEPDDAAEAVQHDIFKLEAGKVDSADFDQLPAENVKGTMVMITVKAEEEDQEAGIGGSSLDDDVKTSVVDDEDGQQEEIAFVAVNSIISDRNKESRGKTLKHAVGSISRSKEDSSHSVVIVSPRTLQGWREEDAGKSIYTKRPWKCVTCIKGFLHTDDLDQHNERFHNKAVGPYVCKICQCRFAEDVLLKKHKRKHFTQYQCLKCELNCRSRNIMKIHYDANHAAKNFKCDSCEEAFASSRLLNRHIDKAHRTLFTCICGKQFNERLQFAAHKRSEHLVKKSTECPVCKMVVKTKHNLVAHMATHDDHASLYCTLCDRFYKNKFSYDLHLNYSRKHLTEDQLKHVCDRCDKRFKTALECDRHIKGVHLNEGDYRCDRCPKVCGRKLTYPRPIALRRHIAKVHDGSYVKVKNKICDICGKAFLTKRYLESHMVTHTGARPYHCKMCPSKFGQSGSLYTHVKLVHEKVKRQRQRRKQDSA